MPYFCGDYLYFKSKLCFFSLLKLLCFAFFDRRSTPKGQRFNLLTQNAKPAKIDQGAKFSIDFLAITLYIKYVTIDTRELITNNRRCKVQKQKIKISSNLRQLLIAVAKAESIKLEKEYYADPHLPQTEYHAQLAEIRRRIQNLEEQEA